MSMNAQVSIDCHWLACTGNHLAGNHHTTIVDDIGHGFSYACDSLSAMGPPCGPFYLEKYKAPL